MSVPSITVPEDTGGGDTGGGNAGDVPQDCQGAIDYLKGLMDQYDSMKDMPMNEVSKVSTAMTAITTTCSVNEMNAFLTDPKISAWVSGT